MIAEYVDSLTGAIATREWSVRKITDNAITRRVKSDWDSVSKELKAYFGETTIRVIDGDCLVAKGVINSNVFAGRVDMQIAVNKIPNHLAR